MEALAISSAEMTPSPFVSSALNIGGSGRRPLPWPRPGPGPPSGGPGGWSGWSACSPGGPPGGRPCRGPPGCALSGPCPGPPCGPRMRRGGGPISSSIVSWPSPFLSSVFNTAGALAISSAEMTPSWFESSAAMTSGIGGRCPRPGHWQPGPPPPGGPPGGPSGGPLLSMPGGPSCPGGGPFCAMRPHAGSASVRATAAICLIFMMSLSFCRSGPIVFFSARAPTVHHNRQNPCKARVCQMPENC